MKELVKAGISHLLVVGSQSSSNSRRLCEVAEKMGVKASLIDGPDDLDLEDLTGKQVLGLTAGASAPEHLVLAVRDLLGRAGWPATEMVTLEENIKFRLPDGLSPKK